VAARINGELVVWESGQLAFGRLQGRLQRRGAAAIRLASEWPAHFVAFDVLRPAGTGTLAWPYRRRRAALEGLFAEHKLTAPWTLCPSTTDPDTAREWLIWSAVGLEGLVPKPLESHTLCESYLVRAAAKEVEVHWSEEDGEPYVWKFTNG
jgi:ATP-dependent DNA ligase